MFNKYYTINIVLLLFVFSVYFADPSRASQTDSIIIPENLATIEGDSHIRNDKPIVILIQDAHCFYPVQKQIVNIIEYLASNYSVSHIFLEGADQYLNADSIKSFPDANIRKNVSEYFLKEGKISGIEYFIINSSSGIKAKGAEDKEVYRENYLAFSESQAVSGEIALTGDRLADILNILKQEFYSKELLETDSREKAYFEGQETLRRYLNFVISKCTVNSIDFNHLKNIVLLEDIITRERELNYFLIEKEKNKLISILQQKLTAEQKAELLDATLNYSLNKISPDSLFNLLVRFCEINSIQTDQFPEIKKYTEYLNRSNLLNMSKLDSEINILTDNIRAKLLQNENQRILTKLDRFLKILKNVTQLKASNDDIKFYSDNKQWFLTNLKTILDKSSSFSYPMSVIEQANFLIEKMRRFEKFYVCVSERDAILAKNTIEEMNSSKISISILITGGFHSEGIQNELTEKGVSAISVRPNLLDTASGYKSNYTNAILGSRNALENYLFMNWNSLAVASVLVEGSPLTQEWKSTVYKRELEITQLALKLCAVRATIENTLGIEAGESISQEIALKIASSLNKEADEFLRVWNNEYKKLTDADHPLIKDLKASISTVKNNLFLELTLNGKKIFFPLETGLALDPATIINSFLTPEKYTSILSGNTYVRETTTSFEQIKYMRERIKDILFNKNSSIDFITQEDKTIITDIIRSIIQSNPDIFGNRNINLRTDYYLEDISDIITKAISDIYLTRVSKIASNSLNYEALLNITGYGASSPLHFMLKAMKTDEPVLASFFEYLIDHYSLFAPEQEINDIRLIVENMFDEYVLIKPEAAQLTIDSYFLSKISDIIYAGLKIGDAIRPHGIASAITYGLNLSESMTFDEILEIHDIFEQESIYEVNEVIELLLASHYINARMAKALIKKPLPFAGLMEILKSPELKSLKQNPTPQNFAFFINKFRDNLEEAVLIELYASCLHFKHPLRTALNSLLAQGWDINNNRSKRFNAIAAQQKFNHITENEDKFNYDMIIISLLGYLPDELFIPEDKIAGVGIHNLDQLDKASPYYDEKILSNFINQAALSGNRITLMSLDPGFTSNLEEITTHCGLTLKRNEYTEIIYSHLKSVDTPVMLYVDKNKIADVEHKLNSLNLSAMVVLIAYDYKTNDISLAGEKRISFLGYWMNLIEILNANFKGSIRFINSNRGVNSRFDDFSRDYIDIETLIPQHAQMSAETVKILANNAKSGTLDTLMMSDHITPDIYPDLINNENFNMDSVITLFRDSDLPVTNELFELLYTKFRTYELKKLFTKTQNMKAANFFIFLVRKNTDITSRLYTDMGTQELINLFVISQKLGFVFDENTIPNDRADGFAMELTYKTALFSPSLAASLLTAYLNKSPDKATGLMRQLANSSPDKSILKKTFIATLKNYAVENPDFIELTPLFESDITPLWHDAFVLNEAIRRKDNPKSLQHYIYGILNIFNEQSDFFEWITINKEKHGDRVNEWLQVVSLYPEIHELRSPELLQSAIMIDIHILNQYREFVTKLSSKKEPYKSLQENIDIFQLIFKSVNSVFSSPIETKMYIFHLLPFVLDYLPENMSLEQTFETYLEKTGRKGNIIQAGIPLYAILPAIIFAEGNTDILENFKTLFSIDYISKSTAEKTHLVSSFLRIFASIDHAYLYESMAPELLPSKDRIKQFLKILNLSTPEKQRQDLLELFQAGKRTKEYVAKHFNTAQLKYSILLKLTRMTSSKTTKKDQKIINDVLDFLFILSENYEMLEQTQGKPNEKFDAIIANFESYSNLRELKSDLMKVFAEFIKIDFPDVFESDEDVIAKLPKIEKIASFWIYKNDWKGENERGIELLRQAIHDYLLDGTSLKHLKYGGTPETAKQLELLEALLYNRIYSRLKKHLHDEQAKQEALKLASHYITIWKTDMSETVDLSLFPPAKSNESVVAWTSDEVPDWINFGMSGGATCLAPGNISVYTKNLPGYIFSGLVSGGLYFGKYKGDIRDRVNQALLPVVIENEPLLFLVNQYYYSSGGQTGDNIGYASVIASIRNAARYGADGIIIPTGSPQHGYVSSLQNFLENNFFTIFEHRSPSGKLIKRERITIKEISTQSVNLIVPKEPNQWRYFDAANGVTGRFYEKLDENFSFVNFEDSIAKELAGIHFEGLEVETPSKIIFIEREELSVDETYIPQKTGVSLSDSLKNFMQEGRLISLAQVKPELRDQFKKLSFTERTTGKFLNNLLYLSEHLSSLVQQEFINEDTPNKFFLLSATQRALPIIRKLSTMLEGQDYVTGEINSKQIIDENTPPRTVFIVDEGILTGSTASKQIDAILANNDVLPEEIIFIALTADPKAVERILRKYPDIKMAVGMFEDRTEQNGTIVSSVIGEQITKDMLFDLSGNPTVSLNNVEYKIIAHTQSSQNYNSFIAETATGEKVFLKTTVSAAEGKQLQKIWELAANSKLKLGVPEVYQYDETTGILATSYIDGPTFNEYIKTTEKSLSELMINVLDALRDASEVARFLSQEGLLYVNITPSNIRLNIKNNRWYITNYSPFPYRVQPLEESGVLRQLEWILEDVLKNFQEYDKDELSDNDKSALIQLQTFISKIKNGQIDKLNKFISLSKELTQSLLSPDNIFRTYSFSDDTSSSLKTILKKLKLNQSDIENIYTMLRLNIFSSDTLSGILKMYSDSDIDSSEPTKNLSLGIMEISEKIEDTVPNFANAEYVFLKEDKHLFDALYSNQSLSDNEISNLSNQTAAFKESLQEQIDSIMENIQSGKPVILAGNIDIIKWIYTEIFNTAGKEASSLIYILPKLSQFRLSSHYNRVLLERAVVSANQLLFTREFKRENQTFNVHETSILNWNELTDLREQNLSAANHIRLRIIDNPRFNVFVRKPDKKLSGIISAAILNYPTIPSGNEIPKTDTNGNALFYYSMFIEPDLSEDTSFRQILVDIQHHISLMHQFSESYRYVSSFEMLNYLITSRYIPIVNKKRDIDDIIEDIVKNDNFENILSLFPNADKDMRPIVSQSINQVWKTDSKKLKNIIETSGQSHFIGQLILRVSENILSNYTDRFPDKRAENIIFSLLGVSLSPVGFLSTSAPVMYDSEEGMQTAFKTYSEKIEDIYPFTTPLNKTLFDRIVNMPEGNDALRIWLKHHDKELFAQWETFLDGPGNIPSHFVEKFGSALLSFLRFTGRTLADKNISDNLISTNGIISQLLNSQWDDPLHPNMRNMSMGHGFSLRMPYIIGSEEDYLQNWFDKDTAVKLNSLINSLSGERREKIIISVMNMNFDENHKNITKLIKAIFKSPLTDESRAEILEHNFDKIAASLQEFDDNTNFLIFDTNANISPAPIIKSLTANPDTVVLLTGDYKNARNFYNSINRYLTEDAKLITNINRRIIGLTPLIKQQPEFIKPFKTFIRFNIIDDSISTTKITALPNITQTHLTEVFSVKPNMISAIMPEMMGQGGILSVICEKLQKDIGELTNFDILFESATGNSIFLKLKLNFGDDQYELLSRAVLKTQAQIRQHDVSRGAEYFDNISDNILSPIPALTMRRIKLNTLNTIDFSVFETYPSGTSVLPVHKPGSEQGNSEENSRIKRIIRSQTQQITRLWQLHGLTPDLNQSNFLVEELRGSINLYLLADLSNMLQTDDETELFFNLVLRFGTNYIEEILKGIFDAFEGNITLFNSFIDNIKSADFTNLTANEILNAADNFLPANTPKPLINHIKLRISNFVKNSSSQTNFDFTEIIPFIENAGPIEKSLIELSNYANSLIQKLSELQSAIEDFTEINTQNTVTVVTENHLRQLENIFISDRKNNLSEHQETIESYLKILQDKNLLLPTQIITARILSYKLLFSEQFNLPNGSITANNLSNPSLTNAMKKIYDIMKNYPDSIIDVAPSIADEADITLNKLWEMVLPGFNEKTQTFSMGTTRIHLTKLPLLIKTENILKSNPILLTADSSSGENLALFQQISSIFKIHMLRTDILSETEQVIRNPNAENQEIREQNQKLSHLRQLLKNQVYPIAVDIQEQSIIKVLSYFHEDQVVDFRKSTSMESFLEHITAKFDSSGLNRISFSIDSSILPEHFKDETDTTIRLIKTIIELRLMLNQAAKGDIEAKEKFMKYSKLLGIEDSSDELLLNEQIKAPQITMTALIIDRIKKSGKLPAISEFLSEISESGKINETKFLVLVNVYNNLALQFFAEKISRLAENSEITVDVDSEAIRLAGKSLLSTGDDYKYIFSLLKEARISVKTFEKGVSAQTVIKYAQSVIPSDMLFIRLSADFLSPSPDKETKKQLNNTSYELIETAL